MTASADTSVTAPVRPRDDDVTGVDRGAVLHAGADERRLGAEQRHGLTLHVRTHEGAVRVVVLEERDHRGGDGHHLARRDVHVVDVDAGDVLDLATLTTDQDALLRERAVRVQRRVGLRDDVQVLLVRGQVVDRVRDLAVDDLAVRGLDEAERVDPRVRRERADQADVRALRRLDRAHAAVVRRVDVADLEAGALTGQTARAERRQTALVGQTRERVGLVHELGQLAGAEELLDGGDDGPDVDQRLRRDRLDVLRGHALAHDALHPGQAGTDLVLDELADGAQTTVAEVVDVVDLDADRRGLAVAETLELGLAGVQAHDVADRRDDVVDGQHALATARRVEAELLVHLVAADLREVVALRVEVEVLEQRLRGLTRRRLARTQLAVDVEQRLVLGDRVVLLQGLADRLVLAELLEDLLVGPAERLEQHGDRLLALAVDADADHVLLVDLELEPGATRRDDLRDEDVLVGRLVDRLLEVDARRADELRDDDTLGAVDDEGALVGHQREVAHEDRLALDLAGLVVRELGGDEERRGVGEVPLLALLDGVLRVVELRLGERQGHGALEVLDRADLLEDLLQTGLGRRGRYGPGHLPASIRSFQISLPSSQSKLSTWRARRFGTSSGSRIFANVTRGGAAGRVAFSLARGVREAAKRGPSGATLTRDSARACRTTLGKFGLEGRADRGGCFGT